MREAVIVSAVRTALGSFNGSLGSIAATRLGAIVIDTAIHRAGIPKEEVNEVMMGQVLPCGYGQNPAKQAAVKAGLPWAAECITINKVCGSALKTVMLAAQAIQVGDADVVVAGGMENMSRAPYYLEKARFGYRMGPGQLQDHMVHDGLWDAVNDFHMGVSNELCSTKYDISREDQDRYAAESYRRTLAAISAGKFKDEIVPVEIPRPKGEPVIFECLDHQRRCRSSGRHGTGESRGAGMSHFGDHRRAGIGRHRHEVRPGGANLGRPQVPCKGGHHQRKSRSIRGQRGLQRLDRGCPASARPGSVDRQCQRRQRGFGPPDRRQRLPGAGNPAARNDQTGQENRPDLSLPGRRGSSGDDR
jgi:hypothetical protein